jgi:hypothetical protein
MQFQYGVHAKDCYERGVKLGVENCCYVSVSNFVYSTPC